MIAKLYGIIDSFYDNSVLLNVNGVCYLIFISRNTLASLPEKGERATLLIKTIFRQDSILLYGFITESEKKWFTTLNHVPGVGAKVSLNILSLLSPDELLHAISSDNGILLCRVPGIGRKVAKRISVELGNDIDKISSFTKHAQENTFSKNIHTYDQNEKTIHDAVSALVNLGYERKEVFSSVTKLANTGKASLDELIRFGLKELKK